MITEYWKYKEKVRKQLNFVKNYFCYNKKNAYFLVMKVLYTIITEVHEVVT